MSRLGICLVYADDVLLISRSRSTLRSLLAIFEDNLEVLNLELNIDKSYYMRIGNRYDATSKNFSSLYGRNFRSVSELRYLGVFIIAGRRFGCSLTYPKKAFNRSVNAIFSKILGTASEHVILHLKG